MQDRVRVLLHDASHSVQLLHSVKLPSTAKIEFQNINVWICPFVFAISRVIGC